MVLTDKEIEEILSKIPTPKLVRIKKPAPPTLMVASDHKLSVPLLRDPDGAAIIRKFRVDQLPSFIVLDKNGAMSGTAFGGIDPKFDITILIAKRVDSLL